MPLPTSSGSKPGSNYWKTNLRYVGILLLVWFLVSYGLGILWAEPLNQFRIPGTGFPLGFWFAQQGSIYVFVILIFTYVFLMNRLDARHGMSEPRRAKPGTPDAPNTPNTPTTPNEPPRP